MARTEWYVDPVSGDDGTGDGTSDATAWATIQHALTNLTQNTTDGDYINLKSNGTHTLTASLDYSSLTLTFDYYIILRGYDSTAGDGGVADIELDGNIMINYLNYICMENLAIHNTGSSVSYAIYVNQRSCIKNVEFSDLTCSVANIFALGSYNNISNCTFFDTSGIGVYVRSSFNRVDNNNFYKAGSRRLTTAISTSNSTNAVITNNTMYLDSSTTGIIADASGGLFISNNTIINYAVMHSFVNGIDLDENQYVTIKNNIIEGWGRGIDIATTTPEQGYELVYNYFYDNNTDISGGPPSGDNAFVFEVGNTSSGASNIAASGAATWANRNTFFAPANDAIGGSETGSASAGAIQLVSGGGGGGSTKLLRYPGMQGGMSG